VGARLPETVTVWIQCECGFRKQVEEPRMSVPDDTLERVVVGMLLKEQPKCPHCGKNNWHVEPVKK